MKTATKIFITMLIITMAVLVYIVYFKDYGVIDTVQSTDWLEENQLYQDEFYTNKPNAKM